jgi:hypothetical protein
MDTMVCALKKLGPRARETKTADVTKRRTVAEIRRKLFSRLITVRWTCNGRQWVLRIRRKRCRQNVCQKLKDTYTG